MKMKINGLSILPALMLFTNVSCNTASVSQDQTSQQEVSENAIPVDDTDSTDPVFRRDLAHAYPEDDLKSAVIAANRVGIKGLQYYSKSDDGNILLSPYSLVLAMGMTAEGASGNTLEEICKAFDMNLDDFRELCLNLKVLTEENASEATVQFADLVALNSLYTIKEEFKYSVVSWYDSCVMNVDFSNSEQASSLINDWASKKTNGMIPSILEEFNPNAVAYLLNALYFDATWSEQFDPMDTWPNYFYADNDNKFRVEMMSRGGDIFYMETEQYSAVELPYGNGGFVMNVVLPAEQVTTDRLLGEFDISTMDLAMQSRSVNVQIPKFKIDSMLDLKDFLSELGMTSLFTNTASLTEIAENTEVVISDVYQKSSISVAEKGTRAASVTIIETEPTAGPPEGETFFIANRPFCFFIRETSSGAILFSGIFRSAE